MFDIHPFSKQPKQLRIHRWAEVGRSHNSGHSPPQQFRDDPRSLHAIADGAADRRPRVGVEDGSEATDLKGQNEGAKVWIETEAAKTTLAADFQAKC